MLFLFRSAPEVEKRIHSKLFRKFWRSRGTKEPAYITVHPQRYQTTIAYSDSVPKQKENESESDLMEN